MDGVPMPDRMWDLIKWCWLQDPSSRPQIEDVVKKMRGLQEVDGHQEFRAHDFGLLGGFTLWYLGAFLAFFLWFSLSLIQYFTSHKQVSPNTRLDSPSHLLLTDVL